VEAPRTTSTCLLKTSEALRGNCCCKKRKNYLPDSQVVERPKSQQRRVAEALHTASDPSLDQRRATVSVDEPAIRPERVPPTPRYKTTFEHPSARSTLPQKANQPQDRYQAAITTTTSVHVERITTTRLVCFLPSCTHIVYDVSPTTLLCWTCGLQSITRYCGPQHRLEDLARHYTTCKPSPLPTMYANWSWPDRFDPEINWQMAPRDTNSRSRFAH